MSRFGPQSGNGRIGGGAMPPLRVTRPARAAARRSQDSVTERLAAELAALRAAQGWTLEQLSERSGVSRAALSRLEHAEVSPSADVLARICGAHGLRPSKLMARIEEAFQASVPAEEQPHWRDPERAVSTRMVSPSGPGLAGEVTEWRLGAGVSADLTNLQNTVRECHLVLLQGRLRVTLDGTPQDLARGDALRFHQGGPVPVVVLGDTGVRLLLFAAAP